MDAMEAARQLGAAIQESPEYKEYQQFKAEVEADSGIKALVDEPALPAAEPEQE